MSGSVCRSAWALILSVALGCGAVSAGQGRRGTRPLIVHVQEALAAPPADCGYFNAWVIGEEPRPDRLEKSVACIAEHARTADPAWVRVYYQGFDSQVAVGLMVGADGGIRHFAYDSDPSGGRGSASTFSEKPCPAPAVQGQWFTCSAP